MKIVNYKRQTDEHLETTKIMNFISCQISALAVWVMIRRNIEMYIIFYFLFMMVLTFIGGVLSSYELRKRKKRKSAQKSEEKSAQGVGEYDI